MEINDIQKRIADKDYRFSEHAIRRMIQRDISVEDIETALKNGEVLEDYPDDKYSPSCLIYGKTESGQVLHIQVSSPPNVVVITVYEPDDKKWIDAKIRRK